MATEIELRLQAAEQRLDVTESRVADLKRQLRAASKACRTAWDLRCRAETINVGREDAARAGTKALAALEPAEQDLIESRWVARNDERIAVEEMAAARLAARAAAARRTGEEQQAAEAREVAGRQLSAWVARCVAGNRLYYPVPRVGRDQFSAMGSQELREFLGDRSTNEFDPVKLRWIARALPPLLAHLLVSHKKRAGERAKVAMRPRRAEDGLDD